MNKIRLLFKKDFLEFSSNFKKGKTKDFLELLSSIFLLSVVFVFLIYVFRHFSKSYVATDFGNVLARSERIKEIMTISFTIIIIANILIGIKRIYSTLVDSKDNDILIYQPISSGQIYVYKLLKIYFSSITSTFLIALPIGIVLDSLSASIGGVGYYLLLFVTIILLPFISCAIASFLVLPYIYVKKKISSKFWLTLLIYVLLIGSGFLIYGYLLKFLTGIIRTGEIKYIFDLQTINGIKKIVKFLYPGQFFTNILLNDKLLLSTIAVLLISLVSILISYVLIKNIYQRLMQRNLEGNQKEYQNEVKIEQKSVTRTLLHKEFLIVLRTPSYAFQYFAMAITLPFMVYICASLLETMIASLTIINCNYALAIFSVSMLSILTNTFCTTNISRDGKMFALMKTMPITINQIVKVKVMFCSLVSFVSVFISSLVLLVSGYISFIYFLATILIGFIFSLSQIAYATRKDMKNPCFPNNEKEEIIDSNSNMATLVMVGLLTTLVASGGAVLISVVMGMKYGEKVATIISLLFVSIISILVLVISLFYLLKNLKNEYYVKE